MAPVRAANRRCKTRGQLAARPLMAYGDTGKHTSRQNKGMMAGAGIKGGGDLDNTVKVYCLLGPVSGLPVAA